MLSVWAGTSQLNDPNGVRLLVDSYVIHPDYVELNRSDIGVITTAEAFVFGDRVMSVMLRMIRI